MSAVAPPDYGTFGAMLADQAKRNGDRLALAFGERRTSYAEFDRIADRIAAALIAHGCGPGARIGALARNSDRYAQLMFGAGRAGAATFTMNWRLARPELEYVAGDSGLGAIFFDPAFAEEARNLRRRNPGLLLVSFGDEAGPEPGFTEFCAAAPETAELPDVDPASPALLLYTSGTTGRPKGVLISHRDTLESFIMLQRAQGRHGTADDEVILLSPPLFHIGGLGILLGAMACGVPTIVLADARMPDMIAAIERHGVTRAVIIPALMPAMIEAARAGAKLGTLKTVLYGMSPIPEPVLTEMIEILGCRFSQSYGMTEISGCATLLGADDHYPGSPHLTAAGRPLPNTRMMIRRLDGSEAAIGEPGEVMLQTPTVAIGLLEGGKAGPVPLEDGWYATGDIGFLDDRGVLFLRDRKKDMIISGGENIYSLEVESALADHPDVERVAIVGVPSDKWGEEVKAVVVPKPGARADAASIVAFARERLAGYKVPKSVDFVDELPVTSVGKIAKNVLRERYWQGRDRRIN
jgi:long-chain acyl-CoA synthetase